MEGSTLPRSILLIKEIMNHNGRQIKHSFMVDGCDEKVKVEIFLQVSPTEYAGILILVA